MAIEQSRRANTLSTDDAYPSDMVNPSFDAYLNHHGTLEGSVGTGYASTYTKTSTLPKELA